MKSQKRMGFLLLFIVLSFSRDLIRLKKRTITVGENRFRSPHEIPDKDGLAIVQLVNGPSSEILDYIAYEMGLPQPAWTQYLDGDAFLVHGNLRKIFETAQEIEEITFFDLYHPSDKTILNYPYGMQPNSRRSLEEVEPTMIEAGCYYHLPKDHILEDFPFDDIKYKISNELIQVYATHHLREITDYLSSLHYVYWVHRAEREQALMNYHARQLLSTGSNKWNYYDAEWLWMRGLKGIGQIVGVVDSGLDYWNCMFDDQDNPLTYPDSFNNNQSLINHRKIVYYKCMDDHEGMDAPSGHGTHVAGSVAGYCLKSQGAVTNNYAGVARAAKIYFAGGSPPGSKGIVVEKPYGSVLFADMVPLGVRIATNSWGCSIATLGLKWDSEFEKYKWDKSGIPGENTTCPSGSGDIASWIGQDAQDAQCRQCYGFKETSYGCANLCNRYTLDEYQLDLWLRENDNFTVLFAAGNDGDKDPGGMLTLSPSTAKNVISVGAHRTTQSGMRFGTEFSDWKEQGYASECCGTTAELVCCPKAQTKFFGEQVEQYNEECMTAFSSRGPIRQMIQPDVVAPGEYVISAHAKGVRDGGYRFDSWIRPAQDNDAALLTNQGTSMATPLMAGLVAVYRQYFVDGFYPGTPAITNPKAYTLKAFIVHGTKTLLGKIIVDGDFYDLENTYPNNEQGFGRPIAQNLLALDGRTNYYLQIHEALNMTQGANFSFCFKKLKDESEADVRATVAWHDIPSHPAASLNTMLINNLDMLGCRQDGQCWPANMNPTRDRTQNILHIRAGPNILKKDDLIGFRVEGTTIRDGGQPFSIVLSGEGLEEASLEKCNIPAWEDAIFPDWNGVVGISMSLSFFLFFVLFWM